MSTELAKSYEPAAVETEAYRVWLDEKCFHADPEAAGEPFTIVIPPPNVTGALHLGHAINTTLQDILTRNHRMRGFNTLWVPGIDHAGIATQAVVEKQLRETEKKSRHDVGREGLVERIWKWKQQYGDRIIEQLKRLGCSCDWDRTRFTLDEMCARAVRETFFKLFKDGLVYRGKRLVNWDIFLQTSISDDEIYHETVKTSLWHIRYPIVWGSDGGEEGGREPLSSNAAPDVHPGLLAEGRPSHMTVATTRPETMLGDTAVAVHSTDARWNWAIGQFVELPLTGRKIPIIADDILVDPKFGSGVVKVTPAHDPNDYAVWQRHQGKPDEIDLINILNPDGTINSAGGKFAGMKRDAARKQVVAELSALELLAKEEPYETQVGHSDRSKTPVEPYLSDQWFVKMAPLAEPALEVVRDGTIKFHPERHGQQYLAWLGEKRDWPISRQLWWGHRIPVWSARYHSSDLILGSLSPARIATALAQKRNDLAVFVAQHEDGSESAFVCLRNSDEFLEKILAREGFVQDPDVLDTWFSSALWPHSTLGWPAQTPELEKYYPTSVLLTGRDIITLWVARMVMMGMYNMGDASSRSTGVPPVTDAQQMQRHGQDAHATSGANIQRGTGGEPVSSSDMQTNHGQAASATLRAKQLGIPFHNVVINPTILDGKGERMSKSKGNGIDPVEIIDIYGADALRFTLTTMATETQDQRMPVKKDAKGRNTSEKFDLGRNFCNKLWNAARFTLANLESIPAEDVDETKWSLADRWIVSRFNHTVAEANDALANYRFDQYARSCYDFFWRDFCDWYVEIAKPALKNPDTAGRTANVLAAALDGALRLMHPMIPFITETIFWRLNEVRPGRGLPGRIECPAGKRLILAAWPAVGEFAEAAEVLFPKIQEIISAIRNLRNVYKVDLKRIVAVSILAPGDATRQIELNRLTIELLATCSLKSVGQDLKPIESAARATAAGCDIFAEDLVDAKAEVERTGKRKEELIKQIAALKGRLSNAGYLAKAPPNLVKQTQDQLAEAEGELGKMG